MLLVVLASRQISSAGPHRRPLRPQARPDWRGWARHMARGPRPADMLGSVVWLAVVRTAHNKVSGCRG